MADHCSICDTRRPEGGTKILVLNGGALWVEFCENCKAEPITNAETGETIAIGTLFARSAGEPDPGITPREPFQRFDDWGDNDWDEQLLEMYRAEEEQERIERENAPTWYEVLEEFILGRHRRKVCNLRA